nr:MAG TPA: SOS-response transcriptional repressor [Caudoviricetes sp.]
MQSELANNNLGDLRKSQKISKSKLSKLSGVNKRSIQRIENENHIPSMKNAYSLCVALGVSIYDVFPIESILNGKSLERSRENTNGK